MKKSIVFLLCFFAISSNGYAATWVRLSENGTSRLMLDKQSVLQQDALKKAWVKVEYKTPQSNPETLGTEYNLSKLLWFFDCAAQKSATSQVFQYLDNELVYSAGVDAKNAEFIEPVPESDVDIAMRHVCLGSKSTVAASPTKSDIAKPTDAKPATAKLVSEKSDLPSNDSGEIEKQPQTPQGTIAKKPEQPNIKVAAKSAIAAIKEISGESRPTKSAVYKTPWAYEGKRGPENWGKLNREFVSCDIGRNQSPINIEKTVVVSLKPFRVIQKFPAKDIFNSGHTVQVSFNVGNMLVLDSAAYQLKQVHFHAPSENKIHGESFPLEAHFVHEDNKGNLSIIGVLFREGKANLGLAKLWSQMPNKESEPIVVKNRVIPSELMPENRSYYRFSGSLTTPPCSEGVRWIIMKTPMTASKEQIEAFEGAVKHHNNRPIQALNGRIVIE